MTLPSTGLLQTFGFSGRSLIYVNQCRRSGAVDIWVEEAAVVIAAAVSKSGWFGEVSSSAERYADGDRLPVPDRFCWLLGQLQTGKR